jgi:hypothetical protein
LIADEAQVAEELMVVGLAVRQSALLVVTMAQEWLLTFGTHEMLDMPVLAQRSDDSLFDRTTACATNWNLIGVNNRSISRSSREEEEED